MTSEIKFRVKIFVFMLAALSSVLILLSVNIHEIYNETGISTTKITLWVQLLTHLIFLALSFYLLFTKNIINYLLYIIFITIVILLIISSHTITWNTRGSPYATIDDWLLYSQRVETSPADPIVTCECNYPFIKMTENDGHSINVFTGGVYPYLLNGIAIQLTCRDVLTDEGYRRFEC